MKQNLNIILQNFLATENLVDEKILVMVSGGVDSMVLLDVASKTIDIKNLAVFHLNHNARKDSDKDQYFVQNICSKKKIAFLHTRLEISPQKNIESEWRKARREAAKKVAQQFGAARILTAHHATDLVETMIFRLTKGCGVDGLAPFETRTKPFWNIPKTVLLDYAQTHQVEWKEDVSNSNTKFERNLIRTEVLPALRKITPNLESVFVREAQTFAKVKNYLAEQLQVCCGEAFKNQAIDLKHFLQLHPTQQTQFLRTVAAKTPSQSEIKDALKWLVNKPKGGSKKEIGETKLFIQNNRITW